jgi:hypothetical protein
VIVAPPHGDLALRRATRTPTGYAVELVDRLRRARMIDGTAAADPGPAARDDSIVSFPGDE